VQRIKLKKTVIGVKAFLFRPEDVKKIRLFPDLME